MTVSSSATGGGRRRIGLIHLEVLDKIHLQILGVSYYQWIPACDSLCWIYILRVFSDEVWKHI